MVDNLEKALFAKEDAKDGLHTLEALSKEEKLKALGRQTSQQESKRWARNESIKRLKEIKKNQPLLKKVKRSLKKLIK